MSLQICDHQLVRRRNLGRVQCFARLRPTDRLVSGVQVLLRFLPITPVVHDTRASLLLLIRSVSNYL
jgi:hypothetical protein